MSAELISVLGRDPLVEFLAIAIPFGTITAKAYAEIINEFARGPYEALWATGAPRRPVLLFARSLPPPVWSLLFLFLFLPGPLPGALALAVCNFGILGRLCAEVMEDQRVAFDLGSMAGTILTLIVLTALVDLISTVVRRTLR